jgi:hypothetical protein
VHAKLVGVQPFRCDVRDVLIGVAGIVKLELILQNGAVTAVPMLARLDAYNGNLADF